VRKWNHVHRPRKRLANEGRRDRATSAAAGSAYPPFREISDVSGLFPIFCRMLPPVNGKSRRINGLHETDKKRHSSLLQSAVANPLFQNILHVSGLFPRILRASERISIG
jgi:hypothetical protein